MTVEDPALANGKWGQYVEDKINQLPPGVRTAARYGFVTRDTALFQGLARAVQYGDFVARAILYDDLVKRQKVEKKEALATVNEAFVNYNRLAGRGRQYAESMGLVWFFNFKMRIMKEAGWTLRNRPLRALFMMVAMPGMDGPVQDNLVSTIIDDRIGYSIGPGMGVRGWSLNPWLQIVN